MVEGETKERLLHEPASENVKEGRNSRVEGVEGVQGP